MVQRCSVSLLLVVFAYTANAQPKTKWIDGLYLQWGYNVEWYTKSTIHFRMNNGDDFTLHKAKAHHNPGFQTIIDKPLQISIPQYNYRLGFYLNRKHTKAFEINFDHAKYIVNKGQLVHVTGQIDHQPVNGDSVLNPDTFLHLEHTDGANWLHFNYVQQKTIATTTQQGRPLLNWIWKAGAGINIPRTDFTWRGERLNNKFHVSGYNAAFESGLRLYPLKRFFIELTGKTGYVKYVNALADTPSAKGNRLSQSFGYFEIIGTFGFDINW